jgi:hypothetical protein
LHDYGHYGSDCVRGWCVLEAFDETPSVRDDCEGDRDSTQRDEDGNRIFPSRMTPGNQWSAVAALAQVRVPPDGAWNGWFPRELFDLLMESRSYRNQRAD